MGCAGCVGHPQLINIGPSMTPTHLPAHVSCLTLDPAAASPMSPNRTAPVTVCTRREMRNPEYAVSSVSTPIATVPGSHPSLH